MKVLLILKPDCIEKNLETEVKSILQSNGYTIVAEKRIEKVPVEMLEKHYNESDERTDEVCEALRPCREYLQTWLLHSIRENTGGVPFEGI